MSISMDAACLQCGLRRNIATVTPLGTDQQTMDFARELMKLYLDGPADVPSTCLPPKLPGCSMSGTAWVWIGSGRKSWIPMPWC